MPDRERVIRGLECCAFGSLSDCKGCPYYIETRCSELLCGEALAVLKEPAQKYVPSIGGARDFGTVSSHWYKCGYPECGFPIDRGDIYCRHCGRPITWEEPGKPEPPKGEDDEGC